MSPRQRKKFKLLKAESFVPPIEGFTQENTYYRVQALRSIPHYGVCKGDIGGYVSSEKNLSHDGLCWIGRNAIVHGNVRIEENAYINDNAQVVCSFPNSSILVNGWAKIDEKATIVIGKIPSKTEKPTDDARVTVRSIIGDNVEICGRANITNVRGINDDVFIGGQAEIFCAKEISGDSSITENVRIQPNAILRNVSASGNAIIHEDACLEDSVISGEVQIGKGETFRDVEFNTRGLFVNPKKTLPEVVVGGKNDTKAASIPSLTKKLVNETENFSQATDPSVIELLDEVKNEILAYETDIIKIIRYPLMTDRTDPYTLDMVMALKAVNRLVIKSTGTALNDAIIDLEKKFLAAESNAIKASASYLTNDEIKKTVTAKNLFNLASDESASEHERKSAFTQGFKQLEGVITVPEIAMDTFRVKLGFKEIAM